jgi:hypothetical protein
LFGFLCFKTERFASAFVAGHRFGELSRVSRQANLVDLAGVYGEFDADVATAGVAADFIAQSCIA